MYLESKFFAHSVIAMLLLDRKVLVFETAVYITVNSTNSKRCRKV